MRANGFTLIEILLGAAISAVLLAALYSVFHSLLQMQTQSYARLEKVIPRTQVAALLKSDLENMVLPTGVLGGCVLGQQSDNSDSRSDMLEFNTTSGRLSDSMPWGDIQQVEYYLDQPDAPTTNSQVSPGLSGAAGSRSGPGSSAAAGARSSPGLSGTASFGGKTAASDASGAGLGLFRAVTRNLLATDIEDEQETSLLLEGVESLEFEYFDGDVWADSWDSTATDNVLPEAVRVRVDFAPDPASGLVDPPLEVVCEVAAESAQTAAAQTAATSPMTKEGPVPSAKK